MPGRIRPTGILDRIGKSEENIPKTISLPLGLGVDVHAGGS